MTAAYSADLTVESWALDLAEHWVESMAEQKALTWVAQKAAMTADYLAVLLESQKVERKAARRVELRESH